MTQEIQFLNDVRTILGSCRLLPGDRIARERIAIMLHGLSGKFFVIWFQGKVVPEQVAEFRRQYETVLDQVQRSIAEVDLNGRFLKVKVELITLTTKERTQNAGEALLRASQELKDGIDALRVKYGEDRLQNA
jgi:hypothetical protein